MSIVFELRLPANPSACALVRPGLRAGLVVVVFVFLVILVRSGTGIVTAIYAAATASGIAASLCQRSIGSDEGTGR